MRSNSTAALAIRKHSPFRCGCKATWSIYAKRPSPAPARSIDSMSAGTSRAALGVDRPAATPTPTARAIPSTAYSAARLPGKVFHAGTAVHAGGGTPSDAGTQPDAGKQPDVGADAAQIITTGGRVLCAVGLGDSVAAAQTQAYALVHAIHWNLVQYLPRHRLSRAIERETRKPAPPG